MIAFEDNDRYFEKNPSEIDRFAKMLEDVITGKIELEKVLKRKFTSVVFQQRKGRVPTTIHFDDDFSRRCTILEILTQDAFGLLYRIASVISSHGCNIEVALITTEGRRAVDVFYLTHNGKKVLPDLEKLLERDLAATLSETS